MTAHVARVLRVFLDDVREPRYGFELMRATGLPSGTLYPILARLEAAGWLVSEQEDIDPKTEGRSARRLYRLTDTAAEMARQELAELSDQLRPRQRRQNPLQPRSNWA